MQFNEYAPKSGWLAHYRRTETRTTIVDTTMACTITLGLVAAYWLVAILELGL